MNLDELALTESNHRKPQDKREY